MKTKTNKFMTSDGYVFYRLGSQWVDNLDADRRDMTFDADADGHPVDRWGEPLEGRYLSDEPGSEDEARGLGRTSADVASTDRASTPKVQKSGRPIQGPRPGPPGGAGQPC